MMVGVHCGEETRRPILTPAFEADVVKVIEDQEAGIATLDAQRAIARIRSHLTNGSNPDLYHEWWCEFDGLVEVHQTGTGELEWECPWCGRVHLFRGDLGVTG